jgi:hypothetical protein
MPRLLAEGAAAASKDSGAGAIRALNRILFRESGRGFPDRHNRAARP